MKTVFKREEIKYILTGSQYLKLRHMINAHMAEDKYGLTTIYTTYFDSSDDIMIRRSLDKPVYKEKIRARSYGAPEDENSTVFLELKKKFKGTVYKRRIAMTLGDYEHYVATGEYRDHSQIFDEIDYAVGLYHAYPRLTMCYDRIAMFCPEDETIRMTFDFNIRCRRNDLDHTAGDRGDLLLPAGSVLLEIKISNSMPMWMVSALSSAGAYPVSVSKYGKYYSQELEGTAGRYGTYSNSIVHAAGAQA
ncbi:MAG: polyphosphate polymerase domain-containing protein [Oscillospiraceae bacterium]|nr:polyphosphate polymerase domain-containing protein [Oscillospiraceae bacterium]